MATIKFINQKNYNPKRRLDLLLHSPDRSDLEGDTELKADTTLNSLYTSILKEAFGKDRPTDDPKIRSVLGAVILAANPLSPCTIATLLDLDIDDVFLRLTSAHSLLIIQDANHSVQPFHKSFPDFIVDPARCTNPRFRVSPPDHHSELLIGCLKLMNRKLKKNMCELSNAVTNNKVDDLQKRVERCVDHSLRYACESWHKHLIDAHRAPAYAPKITSVLHRFLEEKFVFWLEVLSVLGTVRDAVDALDAAGKWLEVCDVRMLDTFPESTHTGFSHHRLSTLSMTTPDLSPGSSRLSAYPLRTSITPPSLYPPKCRACGGFMNNMLIPWRGLYEGYHHHGIRSLRQQNAPT